MEDTATFNKMKYMKPPPLEVIEEFISELNITEKQFERFYSIPFATISKIRAGERSLPARFWRIVYEKIKPAYGSGFLHEAFENQKSAKNNRLAKTLADGIPEMDNHGRLGRLKTK